MDVFEITGLQEGISKAGVNYLQPKDSYQNLINGFVYRQVLQSRQGVGFFATRLSGASRVFGIFEHTLVDGTTELLVIDQNNLYKFNTGTGVFDLIPFGGSIAGYAGFNISAKDFYVSGTSYPFADNTNRFVFCGLGMNPLLTDSTIFQYDGTSVTCYTDVADNPDYVAPLNGPLNSANFVLWFNGRLNFIAPSLNSTEFNQMILYSGIRTAGGNGDNFNIAGAGNFVIDTYQFITGASILGQVMVINLNRSAYVLEKTKDAFNPYFGRAVPGVLGTNAKFSTVSWDDAVVSMGKTGILSCDGRQNLRTDDKIPNFTREDVDQINFNLTYGGFDRLNNQFMWSYKISESDSDTQNSVLVKNYEEGTWSIYDQRFSVLGQTDVGLNLTWDDIEAAGGNESWATWDTTEEIWNRIGLGSEVQKTLAGDDLGFIYELNQDFDDYFTSISNITAGATTTVTVTATGILAGDFVTIASVEGMTEINNFDQSTSRLVKPLYNVISATPTSIVLDVDSTLYTAYTTGGTLSKIIQFKAETIPFNPYREIGRRVYIGYVEFLLEPNGGNLLVDVYADQETSPFIQDVPITPRDPEQQLAEWISLSINQEANFITLVMKQNSPAVQVRLTSLRIHCEPGGLTGN